MTKKLPLLLLLFSFLLSTANAQTVQWQKVIGNRSVDESCMASLKLNSNLYVHGGSFVDNSTNPSYYKPYLLFTNAQGDSLRSVRLFSIKGPVVAVAHADSGGFVTLSNQVNAGNVYDNALICFDSLGNIRWQRHYNLPGNGGNVYDVERVPDGYLLTANKTNNSQAYTTRNSIIKTDLLGNQLWQRDYGGNVEANATAITLLRDGSYMVLGWTTAGSSAAVSSFYKLNLHLVQITPFGDTIRSRIIGSTTNREMGNSIKQTSDGGFIVVGDFVENVNRTRRQGYVVKLDSLLNVEWDLKIMPQEGHSDRGCELYEVQETVNGSFVASGYWEASPYYDRAYVVEISPTGSIISEQKLGLQTLSERFYSMVYDSSGTAWLSGNRGADFYIVKLTGLPLPYQPDYCNAPLQAAFNVQAGPDSVKFTDQSQVSQSFAVISKWEWDFGDGTSQVIYDETAAQTVMHKYQQPYSQLAGTPVRLIVTNNLFCSDTLTLYPWGAPTAVANKLQQLPSRLYPQPMQQQAVLQVQGMEQHEELKVEVTDMLGRVKELPFTVEEAGEQTKLHLQRNNLASGMYLYRLLQNNDVLSTGKLLIVD